MGKDGTTSLSHCLASLPLSSRGGGVVGEAPSSSVVLTNEA